MTSTIYYNKKTGYEAKHPILTRTYDSIGEAALAEALDIVWTDGYLIDVVPQPKFPLFKDGIKVCVHIPDFLITLPDRHKEVREFKGNYEGELLEKWLEKIKLWPANYPNIPYLTVKEGYHRQHTLYTLEQILGYAPPPQINIPQPKNSKIEFHLAKALHRIGARIMG